MPDKSECDHELLFKESLPRDSKWYCRNCFKEIVKLTDASGNDYYSTEISKYSDFGLGGGLGYKMYIKDAWAIEFLVGFGSNLTNREKSPDVISIVGLNVGYRF